MKIKIVVTREGREAHEYYVPAAVAKPALQHAAVNLQPGQRALLYVDAILEAAAVRIGGVVKIYPNRAALIAAATPTQAPLSSFGA